MSDPEADSSTDGTDAEVTESSGTELPETAEASETADPSGTAEASETADASEQAESAAAPRKRSVRSLVSAALLVVALLASAGLASWLYVYQYRPDQQTNPAAAKVALDAATTGTVALLSYSPESLDKDFAAAKSRLTGDFLSYYTQFTEQIVTPAAKEKSVKTAASVVRAAVSQLEPDKAQVLVFINQTTTSKENPDGSFAASSVKVGLKKVDGTWLIESFDPV